MDLRSIYTMFGVRSAKELHNVYAELDQQLMKEGRWDYTNPSLLTNRVRCALARVDLEKLDEEEREWCREIIWFWHHHAISCAIGRHNKPEAQFHAEEALRYQGKGHPNQITYLLHLLVHDKIECAESWAAQIVCDVERNTAAELIREYKAGLFFA